MGLVDHPGVVDGDILATLPDLDTALELRGTPGDPQYYEIINNNLYLYPEPAEACTVKGRAKIIPVLAITDDLPWLGLFNNLIAAAALQISIQGLALLAAPSFLAMVDKGVSAVLVPRQGPLPAKRAVHYF